MISTDGDKVQYRSISVCSNLDEEGTAEDGSGKVVGVSGMWTTQIMPR